MSQTYQDYLASPEWDELRRRCYRRAGHRCENCRLETKLDAHHTIYRQPISLGVVEDLLALCRFCHDQWHRWYDARRLPARVFSRDETLQVLANLRPRSPRNKKQANRAKSQKFKRGQKRKGMTPRQFSNLDIHQKCRRIESDRFTAKKKLEAELLAKSIALNI